jgi:hypothetical protein
MFKRNLLYNPTQYVLKEGEALSSLLFSLASEYAISKVRENEEEVQLNGAH